MPDRGVRVTCTWLPNRTLVETAAPAHTTVPTPNSTRLPIIALGWTAVNAVYPTPSIFADNRSRTSGFPIPTTNQYSCSWLQANSPLCRGRYPALKQTL